MSLLTNPSDDNALVATNSSFIVAGTEESNMLMALFSIRTHFGFCSSADGSILDAALCIGRSLMYYLYQDLASLTTNSERVSQVDRSRVGWLCQG